MFHLLEQLDIDEKITMEEEINFRFTVYVPQENEYKLDTQKYDTLPGYSTATF